MKITIIIATSNKRTKWLINRSLFSVYNQIKINKSQCNILIIDDNENESEIINIKKNVNLLRNKLGLNPTDFHTTVLKNKRTRLMSGTGAWNTAIYKTHKKKPDGYISILDDDDEYLPNHLFECITRIKVNTVAVFQQLIWKNEDGSTMFTKLIKDKLTPENFFVGNPGVQGSNMFFKTQSLIDIDCFDESLPNTTDRDLMIRFLWKNDFNNIEVIAKTGINHYNHSQKKVNNDINRKQQGLDLFYKKYKIHFSEVALKKSLTRARMYFNYIPREQIVICMPLKNSEKTVKNSVLSVLEQINVKREIVLLIGNDNSTDNSEAIVREIASNNSNIVLVNVNFDSVHLNRNFLNEYTRKNYPNCVLIGRLDADDIIYSKNTINQIEKMFDKSNFDVLICGNKQIKNGVILDWKNKPSKKLLQDDFLKNQIFEMKKGNIKAELPSCNTFIKPSLKIEYPDKESAEDHWFTVMALLQKDRLNIQIDEELIYCFYSLDGFTTQENKKTNKYNQSREELYHYFKKETSLKKIENEWSSYIKAEGLSFHRLNLKKNKSKLEKLWLHSYPLNNRIKTLINKIGINNIKLLDVACGPFPKSGLYFENHTIERTLVDALGNEYHSMLKENSVSTFGQNIITCSVEEIENKIKYSKFDIIYSKNALDHTYNPIISISNLINLLSEFGVILLEHYVKEGAYTNYFGLHQWDFYIENNCFFISNKTKTVIQNIDFYFKDVKIESFYEGNKIINIIRKKDNAR